MSDPTIERAEGSPNSPPGRGAQVIVDADSEAGRAMRGVSGTTLEENVLKVQAEILAGKQASGYRSDGSTRTDEPAVDYPVVPPDAGGGVVEIAAQVAANTAAITELQGMVAALQASLTNLVTEFDALDGRMTSLEARVAALEAAP